MTDNKTIALTVVGLATAAVLLQGGVAYSALQGIAHDVATDETHKRAKDAGVVLKDGEKPDRTTSNSIVLAAIEQKDRTDFAWHTVQDHDGHKAKGKLQLELGVYNRVCLNYVTKETGNRAVMRPVGQGTIACSDRSEVHAAYKAAKAQLAHN